MRCAEVVVRAWRIELERDGLAGAEKTAIEPSCALERNGVLQCTVVGPGHRVVRLDVHLARRESVFASVRRPNTHGASVDSGPARSVDDGLGRFGSGRP